MVAHGCYSMLQFSQTQQLTVLTLLKRDSNTMFSCDCCEVFNNSFCHRTLPVAASMHFNIIKGSNYW